MLDEDSDVIAVAFQLHGTKGWDDVGIRLRNGTTRLLQMKHSRSGDTITFGDLIGPGDNGERSLLKSLAAAWKKEHAARGHVECVLVTNRRAGPNWYQGRPPLDLFFTKLKAEMGKVTMISEICWDGEDNRFPDAWTNFVAELSELEPVQQFAFLKNLHLETSAPDLDALEAELHERIATLTGLPNASAHALFNTLHAHLRTWTCDSRRRVEWIEREALRECLAGDEAPPPWLGHCEVETPEPFFPSRLQIVESLRTSLLSSSPHKVDFLSAEPGSGKTSCSSKISRSGALHWKDQCISARFYAYRPIRPGRLDIGSDVAAANPEALWLGLLWQIRDNLRKTRLLSQLHVPVWLDGMPWSVAREHVLRLANALGEQWQRPFIICIDGIDHAARAGRKKLPQFLNTLPPPEAIPENVRFFLAGQPAESYQDEYPFFLRHPHVSVKVHSLGELADEDLRLLWRAAQPRMPQLAENSVIRMLADKTRRRTLPVVYAVEDIRECATIDAALKILDARPLPDSLHQYYDAIWSAAIVTPGDSHRLAASFAMLRERPTGELLASAFSEIGKSIPEWRDILRALRPLVRDTPDGFELVHNDLRVHLEARLAGDLESRADAASMLAEHYRKPTSNRLAAHRSLLDLLLTAGREVEFADDFNVDWVIEAGALGVSDDDLPRECSAAFRAAIARQDWLLLHNVGCASLTLQRLHECVNVWACDADPLDSSEVPPFHSIEGEPLPLELWSASDFSELTSACLDLAEAGDTRRATVILKQWIDGITLQTLVQNVVSVSKTQDAADEDTRTLLNDFERFGRLCAICDWPLGSCVGAPLEIEDYLAAFEEGWVKELTKRPDRRSALRLWSLREPCYISSWIAAVKGAAGCSRWGEVRALLHRLEQCIEKIESADRLVIGWYSARAKPKNPHLWAEIFTGDNYGLTPGETSIFTARVVAQWLTYTDPIKEPAQVVDELFPMLDLRSMDTRNPKAIRLLLRASAIVGRMLRYRDNNDFAGIEAAVPPTVLEPYLKSLWCTTPDWKNLPHEEIQTPGEVGRTLAEIAWESGSFRQLLHRLARERFPEFMLTRDGPRIFDILWELGDRFYLVQAVNEKAQEVLATLHESDTSSRNSIVSNLLHFTERLAMLNLREKLAGRLRTTRIGYGSHKEWVFQPLVRWFNVLRKKSPLHWRSEGFQLLELDYIAEQQGADNRYGDELTAEVGAAAMACGPSDFETLFKALATHDGRSQLWDLTKATQDGFEICLREDPAMNDDSTLARASIAIALGRWPADSALSTVSKLLTAREVSPELAQLPAWKRAVSVAAEIQGLPATIIKSKGKPTSAVEQREMRSAEAILAEIITPTESSWMRLRDVAALAEQADSEAHPNRDHLVATAIATVESAEAFGRYVEFHDIGLMSRLYKSLTEQELWRLLGAITAITGDIRSELNDESWAFTVAFSASTLACRARANEVDESFTLAIVHQLLAMHWKWHGISPLPTRLDFSDSGNWPEATRRMLLTLAHTDGCEALYMTMSGMRFFTEIFPDQIPHLCREGLDQERTSEVILALAQLWATRNPKVLAPVSADFEMLEGCGSLDVRLDAWSVGALKSFRTGKQPRDFQIPAKDQKPEIAFRGDGQLFETDAERNGLNNHSSFSRMANERLRRASIILGPMESAFRHLVRTMRERNEPTPSFFLGLAKNLAADGNYPRPNNQIDNIAGDAIMHQFAGAHWQPGRAAAARLAMGLGMDPWIASATPNPWPNHEDASWPSEYDVERWMERGAPDADEIAQKLRALLKGESLPPDSVALGAVLRIPTYRRDVEFRFWLSELGANNQGKKAIAYTPAGRTLANWLAGWSFATNPTNGSTSVQFTGTLVNYPNSELDVTPTSQWIEDWGWEPNPENALQFLAPNGAVAAWHERWMGCVEHLRQTYRLPLLSRWVAKREFIPSAFDELRGWTRNTQFLSGLRNRAE